MVPRAVPSPEGASVEAAKATLRSMAALVLRGEATTAEAAASLLDGASARGVLEQAASAIDATVSAARAQGVEEARAGWEAARAAEREEERTRTEAALAAEVERVREESGGRSGAVAEHQREGGG